MPKSVKRGRKSVKKGRKSVKKGRRHSANKSNRYSGMNFARTTTCPESACARAFKRPGMRCVSRSNPATGATSCGWTF